MITSISNSQTSTFKFNEDGSTDYVLYNVDKATAKDLYTKTLNWINTTYKNPELVLKAKVENEMIRIETFNTKTFSRKFQSGTIAEYDSKYTLEIEFQDGKYRIKYSHNEISIEGMQVYFKFTDVLNNVADKNGNDFKDCKQQYESNVQSLFNSLNEYITKPKEKW